jgi:hypothetical protein
MSALAVYDGRHAPKLSSYLPFWQDFRSLKWPDEV